MATASENPTADASSKMDHVFQTDFHKCHVTVLLCVNVLIATGIASSIINTICQADPNDNQLGQCIPSGKGRILRTNSLLVIGFLGKDL